MKETWITLLLIPEADVLFLLRKQMSMPQAVGSNPGQTHFPYTLGFINSLIHSFIKNLCSHTLYSHQWRMKGAGESSVAS